MDSYNTVGLTITHLPEISRLIKYVFKMVCCQLVGVGNRVLFYRGWGCDGFRWFPKVSDGLRRFPKVCSEASLLKEDVHG